MPHASDSFWRGAVSMVTPTRGSTAVSRARSKCWTRTPTVVVTMPTRRSVSTYAPETTSPYRISSGIDPEIPPRSPPLDGTVPPRCVRASTPSLPIRTVHAPNARSADARHDARTSLVWRSRTPTSLPREYRVTPTVAVVSHEPPTMLLQRSEARLDEVDDLSSPPNDTLST